MLETSLFINDGTGHFTTRSLPPEVQFSPVYAIKAGDFNGDNNIDILMGGNLFNVKPETGRYDASYGSFLLGDGTGGFRNVKKKVSGLKLEGEVRDVEDFITKDGRILVVSGSNSPLQVFELTSHN